MKKNNFQNLMLLGMGGLAMFQFGLGACQNAAQFADPCLVLTTCDPGDFDILNLPGFGTYEAYNIDPTCTIPLACGASPYPAGPGPRPEGPPL